MLGDQTIIKSTSLLREGIDRSYYITSRARADPLPWTVVGSDKDVKTIETQRQNTITKHLRESKDYPHWEEDLATQSEADVCYFILRRSPYYTPHNIFSSPSLFSRRPFGVRNVYTRLI